MKGKRENIRGIVLAVAIIILLLAAGTFFVVKALVNPKVEEIENKMKEVNESKEKLKQAGLDTNIRLVEAVYENEVGKFAANQKNVKALEEKMKSKLKNTAINPFTLKNEIGLITNMQNASVIYSNDDNANNGGAVDGIWKSEMPGSAGCVAYCAYLNTKGKTPKIDLKIMAYGEDNKRITSLGKEIKR